MLLLLMMMMLMRMVLCAFEFALMERVLVLLCLSRFLWGGGNFQTHTRRDLYLVRKQESESGDARFGIGWTTAVVGATDEAIR